MSDTTTVTAAEIERRTIRRTELIPDKSAFVDTCLPECAGKENYALIGPGVSENPDQVVPVTDPHGFNLGVAAMPNGITNSLHMHFTAEVFSCFSGEWLFRWGVDGAEGEAVVRAGDVITMPTWMFRGFTNIGADDGWMFSSLGMDETGGVVWAPSVLTAAAERGSFLSADNRLVLGKPGEPPTDVQLMTPMPEEEIAKLPPVSAQQMRDRLTTLRTSGGRARRFSTPNCPAVGPSSRWSWATASPRTATRRPGCTTRTVSACPGCVPRPVRACPGTATTPPRS